MAKFYKAANHFIEIVLWRYRKGWKLQSALKRTYNPKSMYVCAYQHFGAEQGHQPGTPVPKGVFLHFSDPHSLPAGRIQKSHLLWRVEIEKGQVLGLQTELVLFTKEWLSSQSQERQRLRPPFFKKSLGCLMKLTIVNIARANASVKLCWGTDFREVKFSQVPKTVEFWQCISIPSFQSSFKQSISEGPLKSYLIPGLSLWRL